MTDPEIVVVGRRVINAAGRKLIEDFEGCRLKAYPDPATNGDPWTIGIGHTGPDVRKGLTITREQVEAIFDADLARFETAISKAAPNATDNQFAAMVALSFNIGIAAFLKSSILRNHIKGDHEAAARSFGLWNKAAGKVMAGLTRRRAAEAALYRKAPA